MSSLNFLALGYGFCKFSVTETSSSCVIEVYSLSCCNVQFCSGDGCESTIRFSTVFRGAAHLCWLNALFVQAYLVNVLHKEASVISQQCLAVEANSVFIQKAE